MLVEIQIKDKTFKLGFGLEVFVKLGEIWGFDTLEEVNERFQVLTDIAPNGKTPLKNIIIMSEIVEGVISANTENTEKITAAEVRSLSIPDFESIISQLVQGFVKNMPQQPQEDETEKKLKSRAKKKNL